MYKALDVKSKDYVALKKLHAGVPFDRLQNESKLLKECNSNYIVRYKDVIWNENELWVPRVVVDEAVDCDGVLSLRFARSLHQEWKAAE